MLWPLIEGEPNFFKLSSQGCETIMPLFTIFQVGNILTGKLNYSHVICKIKTVF